MLFCPKCGSLLVPRKNGEKKALGCSCGFSTNDTANSKITDAVVEHGKKVEVVDREIESLPLTDNPCPKCKHPHSYFWEMQTRAADEPATRFYKCQKCKHIWREYK